MYGPSWLATIEDAEAEVIYGLRAVAREAEVT
jgi:hypothetical protein